MGHEIGTLIHLVHFVHLVGLHGIVRQFRHLHRILPFFLLFHVCSVDLDGHHQLLLFTIIYLSYKSCHFHLSHTLFIVLAHIICTDFSLFTSPIVSRAGIVHAYIYLSLILHINYVATITPPFDLGGIIFICYINLILGLLS